ncbi:hypothetical protein JCM17380_30970 [Desulfosporosinus burensis]
MQNENDVQVQSVGEVPNMKPVGRVIEVINKVIVIFNQGLTWLAGLALILMLIVVVGNALIRVIYRPFAVWQILQSWPVLDSPQFAVPTRLRQLRCRL